MSQPEFPEPRYMDEPVEVRMPKQFRHWCEVQGIYTRPRHQSRSIFSTSKPKFMAGNEDACRRFRVLPHLGWFQMGDNNFDRWANSVGVTMPIPMCQADFDETIDTMLEWWDIRVAYRFLPVAPNYSLHEALLEHPYAIEVPYSRIRTDDRSIDHIEDDLLDLASRLPGRHKIYQSTFMFDNDAAAAMMTLALA